MRKQEEDWDRDNDCNKDCKWEKEPEKDNL